MNDIKIIFSEIFESRKLVWRLARFNAKSDSADNFLGSLWEYVEPSLYAFTFFVMFGLGMYKNDIDGVPYILWITSGILPWFIIMRMFNRGVSSIRSQLGLLTKTKLPVSVAPIIPIFQYAFAFMYMIGAIVLISMLFGMMPSIYLIQLIYIAIIVVVTLTAHNLLNATIAMLIPDYARMLNAVFRLIMFTSGAAINIDGPGIPYFVSQILKLFPFAYVISSIRDAVLFHKWFWEQPTYTAFFWTLSAAMLIVGARLHVKFRDQFMDML